MTEEISSEKPPMPAAQIIEELPTASAVRRVENRTIRQTAMLTAQQEILRKWGYSLFFVNSFIMTLSSALLVIVLSLENYLDFFDPFLLIYTQSPGLTLVVMSCILIGMTIFGFYVWYGKGNYLWLGIALVAMIIFEVRFIIAGYIYLDKASQYVGNTLWRAMQSYSNNTHMQISVDILQLSLKCCGRYFIEDWYDTPTGVLPWSCCVTPSSGGSSNCSTVVNSPCLPKLLEEPKLGIFLVFSILGLLIVLEVILILVLRIMAITSSIRRRR